MLTKEQKLADKIIELEEKLESLEYILEDERQRSHHVISYLEERLEEERHVNR